MYRRKKKSKRRLSASKRPSFTGLPQTGVVERNALLIKKAHGGPSHDMGIIRSVFGQESFDIEKHNAKIMSMIESKDGEVLWKDLSERKKLTSGHLSKTVGDNYSEFISMSRQVLAVENEMTHLHDELQNLSHCIKALASTKATASEGGHSGSGQRHQDDESLVELDQSEKERALLELDKMDEDLTQLAQSQQLVLAVDLLLDCKQSRDWSILGPLDSAHNEAVRLFEEHLEILHQKVRQQLVASETHASGSAAIDLEDFAKSQVLGGASASPSSRSRTFSTLLIRLGFVDECMQLFLQQKSRALQHEIRGIFLSGDTMRYISDLSNVFFAQLIRTTFDYSALLSEMKHIYGAAGVRSALGYTSTANRLPSMLEAPSSAPPPLSSAASTSSPPLGMGGGIGMVAPTAATTTTDSYTHMSRLTVWICHELELFQRLFEKQVFGSVDHSLRNIGECLNLVFKQCDRLEQCGIHVSFLLTAKFAPALRRQIDALFESQLQKVKKALTEDSALRISRKNVKKSGGATAGGGRHSVDRSRDSGASLGGGRRGARHSRRASLKRLSLGETKLSASDLSQVASAAMGIGSAVRKSSSVSLVDSTVAGGVAQICVTDSGASVYLITRSTLNSLWELLHTPYYKGLTRALFGAIMNHMCELFNLYLAGVRQSLKKEVSAANARQRQAHRSATAEKAELCVIDEDTKVEAGVGPMADATAAESAKRAFAKGRRTSFKTLHSTEMVVALSESKEAASDGLTPTQQIALLCNYYYVSGELADRISAQLARLFVENASNCREQMQRLKQSHSDLFFSRVVLEFALLQLYPIRKALRFGVGGIGADCDYLSPTASFELSTVHVTKGCMSAIAKVRELQTELRSYLNPESEDFLPTRILNTVSMVFFKSLSKDQKLMSALSKRLSTEGLKQLHFDLHFMCASLKPLVNSKAVGFRDAFLKSIADNLKPSFDCDVDFEDVSAKFLSHVA